MSSSRRADAYSINTCSAESSSNHILTNGRIYKSQISQKNARYRLPSIYTALEARWHMTLRLPPEDWVGSLFEVYLTILFTLMGDLSALI